MVSNPSDDQLREVTHIAPNLKNEFEYVVGGFNGELKFYDLRKMGEAPVQQKTVIDGGLWRVVPRIIKGSQYLAIAACSEHKFLVLDEARRGS